MSNFWKAGIAIAVIVVAALIVIPKFSQPGAISPGTKGAGDGSSLSMIRTTVENGKPTLLLLRTST